MTRDELNDLSKKELIEHAEIQGVKIAQLDTKGTIVDKILNDFKPVQQKELPMPMIGSLRDLQGNKIDYKMVKLIIFSTDTDKSDVPLIINGHNFVVKRDVEVEIPEPYVQILKDSIINTTRQDPDTGRKMPQLVMTYPHSASSV